MIQLYADFDVLELSDASIDGNARLISHAATGWRTQGTGFGYSAGVTGRAISQLNQRKFRVLITQ